MIVTGATAYPRLWDFARWRAIADSVGAYLLADVSHIAGLIVARQHPDPVPHCDVVTTTTQKTLRGPRSGLILCRAAHGPAIDKAVFPGIQGGPHMHTIFAKAIAFKEAMSEGFQAVQRRTVENARALARDAAFAAREIVVRLLEEMKGAELDQTLLRAACRELEELRASGSLGNVVIESAAPLDRPALAAIAEAAGISPDTATHRVDPDLVVGVRVLTAKGLVDTSAAGLAAQAERVLVREIEREDADRG